MDWTTTTYEGTYMNGTPGGTPSRGATMLYELCRGVQEREIALGIPVTEFYRADGTLTDTFTIEDFRGSYISGDDPPARLNLQRVALRITAFVGGSGFGNVYYARLSDSDPLQWWHDEDATYSFAVCRWKRTIDGTTYYNSITELSDAVGEVINATLFNSRNNLASWPQRLQDALDLLIYPEIYLYPRTRELTASQSGYDRPGFDPEDSPANPARSYLTPDDAWAAKYNYPRTWDGYQPFTVEEPSVQWGISSQLVGSTNIPIFQNFFRYSAGIRTYQSFYFDTSRVSGELYDVAIYIKRQYSLLDVFFRTFITAEVLNIGTFTNDNVGGSSRYYAVPDGEVDLDSDFESSIRMINPIPSTIGIDGISGAISVSGLRLTIDLTPELTNTPD